MRLESRKYLRDIEQAAGLAGEFLAGKSFDDYSATPMLRAAVERQCEILGEALAQLAKTDPGTVAQVSEYRRIIAFRNILIHGYAEVDHRIVWEVATVKVAALAAEVRAILDAADRPDARTAMRGWCALQEFASQVVTGGFERLSTATMHDGRPRFSRVGHHRPLLLQA